MTDADFDDVLLEIERYPGLYGAIGPKVLAGVSLLRAERDRAKEQVLEANRLIDKLMPERDALRKLLLRWLQIINHAKKTYATVAEWDKLRQESAAMLTGKKP